MRRNLARFAIIHNSDNHPDVGGGVINAPLQPARDNVCVMHPLIASIPVPMRVKGEVRWRNLTHEGGRVRHRGRLK
jgi:hypothetical protein